MRTVRTIYSSLDEAFGDHAEIAVGDTYVRVSFNEDTTLDVFFAQMSNEIRGHVDGEFVHMSCESTESDVIRTISSLV